MMYELGKSPPGFSHQRSTVPVRFGLFQVKSWTRLKECHIMRVLLEWLEWVVYINKGSEGAAIDTCRMFGMMGGNRCG